MTRADELRQLADLIGDEGTVPRLLRNAAKELDALHADIGWRIEQAEAQKPHNQPAGKFVPTPNEHCDCFFCLAHRQKEATECGPKTTSSKN